MGKRTCTVDQCERPYQAKGLCATHRYRQNRGLDLLAPIGQGGLPKTPEAVLIARFWEQVDQTGDGCHEWQQNRRDPPLDYGLAGSRIFGTVRAHKIAWILTYGPVPKGLCVLHHCDNPPCCNPEHLFLGTHADNTADMMAKGRHWGQRNTRLYCKRGHRLIPTATRRICPTCKRRQRKDQ
jgi:hypothetical protein